MHDLSALESNESDEVMEWEEQSEEPEFEGPDHEEDQEQDEADELESAAELLAVGNEAELDHFLGDLIRKAASSLGRVVKAKTGNSLGGLLKGFARQALPMVATAMGGPVAGFAAKGGLDAAMKAFGLELEGLSEEDQELEIARRYVRVANATARRVLRQASVRDHRAQARSALRWAVRRYAPNLLRRQYWQRRHPYWQHPRGFPANYFNNQPPPGYGPNYGADLGANYGQNDGATPQLGAPGAYQQQAPTGAYQQQAPTGEYQQPAPAYVPPTQCPACAPCPACPECGAPTPTPTPAPDTTQTPPNPPNQSKEFEFGYEDEEEEAHEHEHQYEYAPSRGDAGSGGRWVRRGNRIILYGA